jgi:hypothetical protein
MKPFSRIALLCLLFAAPAVGAPRRIERNTDSVLELTPDLKLSVDWSRLSVESPRAKTTLPVVYGSSDRGFPDAIQYAVVSPSGTVTLHYES